jgi:hypothetical protein
MYHCITMRGEKNYMELSAHHIATVTAILFCYFTNFEHYGPFILIASDISDALLNWGKIYRDLFGFTGLEGDIMFAIVMITWFVTRNVFMLGCWYHSIKKFHPFQQVVLFDKKFDSAW